PAVNVEDFCLLNGNSYYLLSDNNIYLFNEREYKKVYATENNRKIISSISNNNQLMAVFNQSNSKNILSNQSIVNGIEDDVGNIFEVIKENWNRIVINKNNTLFAEIISQRSDLASAKFLGNTPEGDIYIYFEHVAQQVPLEVNKYIYMYNYNGSIIQKIILPKVSYTYIFKEFYVDSKGNLHHMISMHEGIYITKWDKNELVNSKTIDSEYPEKFNDNFHFNQIEEPDPDLPKDINLKYESFLFDPVSRDSALSKGDTYTLHSWVAASNNLTHGRITDPNGVEIETPSWVQ
ncbi:unnamed protein product, partial [marine sediment metagenome]